MESFVKNIEVKQLTTNQDLIAVLEKLGDASIILMGDTYQIEAIGYGNWFSIIKKILPEYCCHELTTPVRSTDQY